jgi:hypothetical protein
MAGYLTVSLMATIIMFSPARASQTIEDMLAEFGNTQAPVFSASAGKATWLREKDGRSCTSCHTDSVFVQGRHERTGKIIEPMAPSVNPDRYTDRKKINKWLLRNCKWTFGRECTLQEKGDVLLWLSQQ